MGASQWRRPTSRRAPRPDHAGGSGLSGALDLAQGFLAARPRSEHEVRRRLQKAGHDTETIDAALERLRRASLVDDAAFASYWLEQRQTFRPRGARLLNAELRQHGVSAALASETAASTAETAQEDAYRAAQRRAALLAHQPGLDERLFAQRLGQFLARRGFDWDVIAPTVERLWRERDQ